MTPRPEDAPAPKTPASDSLTRSAGTDHPLPEGEGRKQQGSVRRHPLPKDKGGKSEAIPRPRRAYRRRKPLPITRAQRRASRANLARAREALRQRGWPHSEKQRAAGRENIRKAQAAVRERGLPDTPARRAAAAANLAKANARLRELGYPRNENQKSAARANLEKSRPLSRLPENYARYHGHRLRHGLQVKTLEQTLRLLGEDPGEFEAHGERFRRVFAPTSLVEERVVRRIAAAVWRFLRLHRAQERWQRERLAELFEEAPFLLPLEAETTRRRALVLMSVLTDVEQLMLHEKRLTAGVERSLRLLLRLRSEGEPEFMLYTRRTEQEFAESAALEKELEEEQREIEAEERSLEFRTNLAMQVPELARKLVGKGRRYRPS